MKEYLTFRRMIMPIAIQVLFWIGVAAALIGGLVILVQAKGDQKLLGILYIILGPLVVRLYAEILIVIFRINDTLTDIRRNTESRPGPPATY